MSNKHHDLLGVPKHANQHRLSRLIMEVHTDELRIMASAVESYTDELIAALEAAEKRISELESQKSTLMKFIRDSCYVFDGDDADISDAYIDAISSGLMPKLESGPLCNQPLFWVRVKSDGGYDGPIHDSKLEDVRKKSGQWLPLTLAVVVPELEAKDKQIADLKEAFSIALSAAGIDVPAAAGKGE